MECFSFYKVFIVCVLILSLTVVHASVGRISGTRNALKGGVLNHGTGPRVKRAVSGRHDDLNAIGKRLRDFVGKRVWSLANSLADDSYDENRHGARLLHHNIDSFRNQATVQKRLRDFIGKRDSNRNLRGAFLDKKDDYMIREFVGKRSDGITDEREDAVNVDRPLLFSDTSDGGWNVVDIDGSAFSGNGDVYPYPYYMPVEKRLRDFIGKRNLHSLYDKVEKRLRDFVGKRNINLRHQQRGKRLRDFIGKRDLQYLPFITRRPYVTNNVFSNAGNALGPTPQRGQQYNLPAKRLRDFVGKRTPENLSSHFLGHLPGSADTMNSVPRFLHEDGFIYPSELTASGSVQKRRGEFVGKRFEHEDYENPDIPETWIRHNSNDGDVDAYDDFSFQKRIRDFVGKRSDSNHILMRHGVNLSKRLRDFIGKRSVVSKRVREFVGKRGFPTEWALDGTPRAARTYLIHSNRLGSSVPADVLAILQHVEKRVRDFVGRR